MRRERVALVLAAVLGCGAEEASVPAVDVLLVGGAVYTLDWPPPDSVTGRPSPASSWTEAHGWRPSAGAVAVAGGRIVWLGSEADAAVWRARAVRVLDVAGGAVLPGLVSPEDLRSAWPEPEPGDGDSVTVEQAVRAAGGGAQLVVDGPADLVVVEPDPFRSERPVWLGTGRVLHRMVAGRLDPPDGG